jgi:hypothetical protein
MRRFSVSIRRDTNPSKKYVCVNASQCHAISQDFLPSQLKYDDPLRSHSVYFNHGGVQRSVWPCSSGRPADRHESNPRR